MLEEAVVPGAAQQFADSRAPRSMWRTVAVVLSLPGLLAVRDARVGPPFLHTLGEPGANPCEGLALGSVGRLVEKGRGVIIRRSFNAGHCIRLAAGAGG